MQMVKKKHQPRGLEPRSSFSLMDVRISAAPAPHFVTQTIALCRGDVYRMNPFRLQNVERPGHMRRTGRDEDGELSVGVLFDNEGGHERLLYFHQRRLE